MGGGSWRYARPGSQKEGGGGGGCRCMAVGQPTTWGGRGHRAVGKGGGTLWGEGAG